MARELTASERALQILAEIEMEDKLKQNRKQSMQYNSQENVPSEGISTEGSNVAKQKNPTPSFSDKQEPSSFKLSNLTQNDIVNGFVLSELLNKPLALRRNRRF